MAFMWGKNIMRCARVFLLLLWIVSGATFNYCKAETNPILALFLGYSKAVNTVALSEDGRQAVRRAGQRVAACCAPASIGRV